MSIINSSSPDKDLIQGCCRGERAAQQELYTRYSPRMFAICLRYSEDYHQAEDLLQEGFIKVFRHVSGFRSEGSFEGWLRRIFVNTAIEHHRRKHHLYPLVEVLNTEMEIQDKGVLEQLAADDLMDMVNSLSPGYRTVFNLYAVEGYNHKDIADMLGISEGTSKSQLARARVILQKKVEQQQFRVGYLSDYQGQESASETGKLKSGTLNVREKVRKTGQLLKARGA
jgi:RNA polymerase sigma factor (sigma-70 family)